MVRLDGNLHHTPPQDENGELFLKHALHVAALSTDHSLPPSYFIIGSQPKLSVGSRCKSMVMLKLLGLVTVDLLPLSPALVPFQLVLCDGSTIVGWGIPPKAEVVLGSTGHLGRIGLGWTEGRDHQGTLCRDNGNKK